MNTKPRNDEDGRLTTRSDRKAGESTGVDRYECQVCYHVYDEKKGDPKRNIPPGTPFEALPDDWECPICRSSKEFFELL
jgi:rubredoxin